MDSQQEDYVSLPREKNTYPLMVEAIKTRYGPSKFFTRGRGMAAASSITTSSACPNFTASAGWIYWPTKKENNESK